MSHKKLFSLRVHYIQSNTITTAIEEKTRVWFLMHDLLELIGSSDISKIYLTHALPDEFTHVQKLRHDHFEELWINEVGAQFLIHLSEVNDPQSLVKQIYQQIVYPIRRGGNLIQGEIS